MALSDVLNNLTSARDALVTAINNKGGTVAASATIRQCAAAVTALPEGGTGGGSSLLQGVAFFSSLTDVETSETADKMNMSGTVSVTNVGGVTSGNFNGNSYLSTNAYKKLPQFSVCVWLNCATEMSNYGWAIASGEFNFRMEIYNSAIYATAWGANGINKDPLEGRVSTALTINTWQFIVYSFDSSNYRLHKNAVLVSQAEKEKANFTPFFDNICLGGVSNSMFGRFNGNISDAIIYNRVLSDDEIAELYALGPGGFSSVWNGKSSSGGGDGGSGESGGGGESGGSSIYTGDLVATVYGTPVGDITATLTCVNHDAIRQSDVVWEGKATAIIDYSFSVNTYSGKWSLNVDTDIMGDIAYGGDNFTTDNSVPWGATWTNTGGTSRTCEVSKA